jgi:cell wall-associated NlpC family hydrolase
MVVLVLACIVSCGLPLVAAVIGSSVAAAGCLNNDGQPATSLPAVPGYTSDQIRNAATIIAVGQAMHIPTRGQIIAVDAAITESVLTNLAGGDRDSIGLFQQRPSQGWGTPQQIHQPLYAATEFYLHLQAIPAWQTLPAGQAEQAVQRSAHSDRYALHESAAEQLVQQLAPTTVNLSAPRTTDPSPSSTVSPPTNGYCLADGGDGHTGDGQTQLPPGYTLPTNAQQAAAVGFALAQLGKPYVFGAQGPDTYDCSGLVMAAWAHAGVTIPRSTYQQVHTGIAITSVSAMQPGDLIFIPGSDGTTQRPGHVGMYIGTDHDGNRYLIQAPHTGDHVKISTVKSWTSQIVAIRRPISLGL